METRATETRDVQHKVENGIERVVYLPRQRRFETPILMLHGMWHGAWCWQHWQELFAEWVMYQHNPPFWYPPEQVKTPLLWLAGEMDAIIGVEAERQSAAHYQADFVVVPDAAHNLMMEPNLRETAETIHDWLNARGIA